MFLEKNNILISKIIYLYISIIKSKFNIVNNLKSKLITGNSFIKFCLISLSLLIKVYWILNKPLGGYGISINKFSINLSIGIVIFNSLLLFLFEYKHKFWIIVSYSLKKGYIEINKRHFVM